MLQNFCFLPKCQPYFSQIDSKLSIELSMSFEDRLAKHVSSECESRIGKGAFDSLLDSLISKQYHNVVTQLLECK